MDAFYASVELLRYPQLLGEPVVIGGGRRRAGQGDGPGTDGGGFARLRDYAGRGVITTATYAARAFGVHSGMGLMKAAQLCPQAVLLPVDFDEYRRFSRLFKQVVTGFTLQMEDRGIDEVYIDLTAVPGVETAAGRVLAARIQAAVLERTGLTCSIGVAPNKLLAKLSSEMHKPNGITVIDDDDIESVIWPLACRKINGIGPKAATRLTELGIHTIGDLARYERQRLIELFGRSFGAWLHEAAWGRDEREVVTASEPVSMSCETTFEKDLHAVHDRAELSRIFTSLCQRLAADLERKGYVGRNIGIKLKYDNFRTVTRGATIDRPTADAAEIRRTAGLCLKRAPLERRLRLLGVRIGGLVRRGEVAATTATVATTLELF
jgi:DNA polymerase-4